MRAGALAVASLVAAGCAHIEAPSGGPVDKTPPELITTRPETLAVVPRWRAPVTFVFDERISEQQIRDAVVVSPHTSPVAIDKGRDAIEVSLRGGWRPNTVYHVTVLPVVRDLFGNQRREPIRLVFSTGPEIPNTSVSGSVVDRITGRPDTSARIEAVRRADSLVYVAVPDTLGRFTVGHIPVGAYLLRAYRDQNRNRTRDTYEAGDSATVEVAEAQADTTPVRLAVVEPDSTAPRAASAEAAPGRVTVRFDDFLDPDQAFPPASVQVTGPAGPVPVGAVTVPQPESGADTTAAQIRLPSRSLSIELADSARLTPGAKYTVAVRGVRNVVGLTGDSQVELTAPAAPAASDSTAAGDSTAAPRPD